MKILKVYLKFRKRKENGQLYGFIRRESNGNWKGCEESYQGGKRIVLLAKELIPIALEDVLYQARIIPMDNGKPGFIATNLKVVKFKAEIETILRPDGFKLLVKFGNRVFKYDPNGKRRNERSASAIAELIRHRLDIDNAQEVADRFENEVYLTTQKYKYKVAI